MAIYGIGAAYGNVDVSAKFIKKKLACIGWKEVEAQPLYSIIKHFKIGDIVYIKAHPANIGLIIKAVGIVVDDQLQHDKELRWGVRVEWLWTHKKGKEVRMGQIKDKYPVRNITLYEEFSRPIQDKVIKLLLTAIKSH